MYAGILELQPNLFLLLPKILNAVRSHGNLTFPRLWRGQADADLGLLNELIQQLLLLELTLLLLELGYFLLISFHVVLRLEELCFCLVEGIAQSFDTQLVLLQ